ncbi:putative sodium-coupled neutral amino acid transporter 7 [Schistocerca gregaria]|uniref:putative sodium-coupled neutral amino acid transporter 7 n=1 Tax=Schistocerca gregaria TaxID=7010 RepID=UPI00211E2E94|nr:putative sodium-coupled neutral amino acid transporter 7 [Schistocerca gregaria]
MYSGDVDNMDDSDVNSANELVLSTFSANVPATDVSNGGSNRVSAIFLIVNAALGAGLLNFPQAFDQAGGIATAVVVQVVLLVWILGALVTLAHCSDETGARTLQDILEGLCGTPGLIACCLCVALYCFGTCLTFLVIIGDQFDRVFSSLHGSDFCHYWYMNRIFTIVASSTVCILPFCYSRRIDFLKYVSYLGVGAVFYVVVLIVYQKFAGEFTPGPVKTSPTEWTDVFLVVPVICFGYQCHVSVIPIYSCLHERTIFNFSICCGAAVFICMLSYTLAGTFGYLTFGADVTSDILESYSGYHPSVLIGITAIAIKTYTTYPILLFCGREAVNKIWCTFFYNSQADIAVKEPMRRAVIATTWFILTLLLAVLIPDMGIVIDCLGSLAAIFIFVFPGICWMQSTLHKDPLILLNKDRFYIFLSVLYILTGTFVFGVVLVQAIERFSEKDQSPIRLCV